MPKLSSFDAMVGAGFSRRAAFEDATAALLQFGRLRSTPNSRSSEISARWLKPAPTEMQPKRSVGSRRIFTEIDTLTHQAKAMITFLFFVSLLLIIVGILVHLTMKKQTGPNQFGEFGKLIGVSGVALGVILLSMLCLTKVPNGHVGVISNFGDVSENTLDPGLSFVAPWSEVAKISGQTLEIKEDMQVPTKEGLTVGLETSVLWHINPRKAAILYRTVGEEYWDVLIIPNFRSVVRGVTASYEAKALYASTRDEVQNKISQELMRLVESRGIVIEATPLRKVTLPEPVTAALNAKASAEQTADAMKFKLLAEQQEAERKIIEARGDSAAQAIINTTISDRYLTLKGIEATLELAKSTNAKTVVIGAGEKGMPLILGQ